MSATGNSSQKQCSWIISNPGQAYCECGQPAAFRDMETGDALCSEHAEDYASIFGWESLESLTVEEKQ